MLADGLAAGRGWLAMPGDAAHWKRRRRRGPGSSGALEDAAKEERRGEREASSLRATHGLLHTLATSSRLDRPYLSPLPWSRLINLRLSLLTVT